MSAYRIGVIGDVHANFRALESALHVIADRGVDETVFLGDILGYGVNINSVIDRIAEICSRGKVTLLKGNHDSLYLTAERSVSFEYESKLPIWLRESIAHTRENISLNIFDGLPFLDAYIYKKILFSHANPFGNNDWRYLNNEVEHEAACDAIKDQGFVVGVFGHTHRPKVFDGSQKRFLDINKGPLNLNIGGGPFVLNAGSIGQPRDINSGAVYVLYIALDSNDLTVDYWEIKYDLASHIEELQSSPMSPNTIEKLTSFFLSSN